MATNNLEVKFKVETSDLRKGSSDAKRTVKDTADQMARDVKGAAQDMTSSMGQAASSMDKVNDATKSIADAADTASNGVRNLEQNVERSASNMERNLAKVSKQMSVMQMFHMGTRAVNMLGGAASNIARIAGDKDTAEAIDASSGILAGTLQGAAMGSWFGPWGTAIGAIGGAAYGLLDAAAKQKEAAEKQLEAANAQIKDAKLTVSEITAARNRRERLKEIEEIANAPVFDEKTAQHMVDSAKAGVRFSEEQQNRMFDMLYGRAPMRVNDWGEMFGHPGETKFKVANRVIDLSKMPSVLPAFNWMDEKAQDAMTHYFTEMFTRETMADYWNQNKFFTRDTFEKMFTGTEGGEPLWFGFKDFFSYIMEYDKVGIQDAVANFYQYLKNGAVITAKSLEQADQILADLAPIQARLDRESARRMYAPLPVDEDYFVPQTAFEQEPWPEEKPTIDREALAAGTKRLRDLTALLNGVVNGAGFSSPTDALTRIGGGRGYASYNDSAARVQMKIEASLRTLIKNQTDQNYEILHAIENISVSDPDIAWQQEQ